MRTTGFAAEQDAGHALWSGILGTPDQSLRDDGWGARTRMKDASSTDVVVHAGRALTSFYQCGDLYGFDPLTLEQLGGQTWNGRFPADWGISAHTKVDQHSGEMLVFNYAKTAPYMHYGVVDADHALVHWVDVPLPGPRLPHDMAFTEHYAILNDCPLFWDDDLLAKSARTAFSARPPTRFAVIRARRDRRHPMVRGPSHLRPALGERLRGGRRDRARRLLPGRLHAEERRRDRTCTGARSAASIRTA